MAQRFYCTYTNQFLTFYPAPTGPFPVGTVDRVMIDPARGTNLYRYVHADERVHGDILVSGVHAAGENGMPIHPLWQAVGGGSDILS